MKKGIIFDMDGTLWDSAQGVAKSWTEKLQELYPDMGEITEKDIKSVMGLSMDKIADIFFGMLPEKEKNELLDTCGDYENDYLREHGGILYPDLEQVLAELKKDYHLYIVSNCQSGYIEAFLDHYDFWKYFEDIECYGNNELPKGDNIAGIIRRNDVTNAVYVGDIQGDYDATMSAKEQLKDEGVKLDFILADYGFGDVDAKVREIANLKELPQVVSDILD
ncbi:MAG: HAD family hydrolase [Lachnospiraceae bacterium]|nr:HAD family hydrolase [Lachnospiraceae bacterium]